MINQLNAVVKSIEADGDLRLVTVQAAGITFTTLVTNTPYNTDFLQEGKAVIMVFKDEAVAIGKNLNGQISIRNRIFCIVSALQMGNVLTQVSLNSKGNTFTSVITTGAAKELELQVGDTVEALIKTTDISVMAPEV